MDSDRRSASGSEPSRRALLASLGAGSLASVAGCLTTDSGGTPTAEPDTPTEATDATTEPDTDETPTSAPGGPTVEPVGDTWDEGGPPDRSNWTVTFQDAFDAGELDWDVWELGYGPDSEKPCAGSECAREENVAVEDGRLVLTTTPEGADEIPNDVWLADWTTGAVSTASSFQQAYGYWEARTKIPVQPGALPAFWAWTDHGTPPEIDFYEVFGDDPEPAVSVYVDCNDDVEGQGRGGRISPDRPVDEAFHTFGCAWTPESVTWYLDGDERFRVDGFWIEDCLDPEPMFPMLNTYVIDEDDWAGDENGGDPRDADYPYTHEVEWVRIWQRNDLG